MPIEKNCLQCSTAFRVKPSHKTQNFCSKACMTAFEGIHGRLAARVPNTEFSCRECGKPFSYKPSYVTAYRKKFGKDPEYCSVPCSAIGRRKNTMDKHRFACLYCGKEQSRRRKPEGHVYREQKFCDVECKAAHQRSKAFAKFEAGNFGRHIKRNGYVWISIPALANDGVNKTEMLEHRYVMEQHLGRKLRPDETVHHKNGNRAHNTMDNLELFSSRHGPGQRVIDKIAFAIEMLQLYPEFGHTAGYELKPCEHPTDAPPHETR